MSPFKTILKKVVLVLLILLVFFTGYFTWFKVIEKRPESFIPPDFLFIFQTKNLFSLFNKLNETRLLDAIFYDRQMKETYKVLIDVKSQLSGPKQSLLHFINFPATVVFQKDHKTVVLFDTGLATPILQLTSLALKNIFSDSEKFSFTADRYKQFTINRITLLKKRQNFYFAQVKNLLIFSMDKYSIITCLEDHLSQNHLLRNENFLQVRAQLGTRSLLRVFFNITSLLDEMATSAPELHQTLKTLSILNIAGADFVLENEAVKINSFFSTSFQDENLLKFFLSTPRKIGPYSLIPERTEDFISVTFEDFQDVWNYFNKILLLTGQKDKQEELAGRKNAVEQILGIKLEDFLFSWLDQEITLLHLKGAQDPVLLLAVKDSSKIREVFQKLYEKQILTRYSSVKYKGVNIEQIKLSSFFEFLSGIFSPDLDLPYYAVFNDCIMFCRKMETLEALIEAVQKDELLIFHENVKRLHAQVPEANLLFYWDLVQGSPGWLLPNNFFTRIVKNYMYGMLSLEFVDKGIKSKIVLSEPRSGGIILMKDWPVNLNSVFWSSPLIYPGDAKNLDEIVQGTEPGKIFIYDVFAEPVMNWPVKMSGALKSAPFLVFHPDKKKMCIGAVSESGQLSLWSMDGFLMENFPVSVEGDITKTPLIEDINKDNRPEIILANQKGKIFVVDLKGSILPGFPVEMEKSIEPDLVCVDINQDKNKEILCSTRSLGGDLFFINDTGEINKDKVLSTGTFNPSAPVVVSKDKEIFILLVTGNGNLFIWDRSKKLLPGFPVALEDKFVNSPGVEDLNNDGKAEIVLLSSSGRLWELDWSGHLLAQLDLNFKPLENERITFFDVDHDQSKEIIIPGTDNYVRFFHVHGDLAFKVRGSFTPVIKDLDKDGKYEIVTSSDDGNVYLYKVP